MDLDFVDLEALERSIEGNANDENVAEILIKNMKNAPENVVHKIFKRWSQKLMNAMLKYPHVLDIDECCSCYFKDCLLHLVIEYYSNDCKSLDLLLDSLINQGIDVNTQTLSYRRQTPVHYATELSTPSIMQKLIEAGADINRPNTFGFTPFLTAVFKNDFEKVSLLLCYGADVSLSIFDWSTTLIEMLRWRTLKEKEEELFRIILNYYDKIALNSQYGGQTILLFALCYGNDVVADIIKAGADVNLYQMSVKYLNFSLSEYENNFIFKEIWTRIDFEEFHDEDGTFLETLVTNCKYHSGQWIETMLLVLNSPMISKIINAKIDSDIFDHLYTEFFTRKIGENDRLSLSAAFLSYGAPVYEHNLIVIFKYYGFNEDLDLFLNCSFITHKWSFNISFVKIILGFEPLKDVNYIATVLRSSLKEHELDVECVLKQCEYYSLSQEVKDMLISSSSPQVTKEVKEKLEKVPQLPSLLQLARDVTRKLIKRNIPDRDPNYRLYRSIKKLQLPKKLLDILVLKESLYK